MSIATQDTGTEILRASLPFEIARAGTDESGQYRVSGYMNTFRVMHSRRILHPRGFLAWKKKNPNAVLPMLANHGEVEAFATIGEWDTFAYHEGKGMLWAGRVGSGTRTADEARVLLEQKLLRQLSFGFVSRQARWINVKDADVDPLIRGPMEEAELDEVYAHLDWYPVEGSIVDVADDPGARLAAKLGGSPELAAVLAGLQARFDEWVESFREAALQALCDRELIDSAKALRDDWSEEREVETDELAALRQRLAGFGATDGES
jgi:phage head maturation protease